MYSCKQFPVGVGRNRNCKIPPARSTWPLLCSIAIFLVVLALQGGGASAQNSNNKESKETVDYWQPKWMLRELWGPGRMPKGMQVRVLRHWTYVNHGVPKTYDGAIPTIKNTSEALLAGAQLYGRHCSSCHGLKGLGDGDASKSLLPSPALLAYMIKRPVSADEYLLWAISDGGRSFQTAMPAFKDKLARDDIWRVIAFMRNGFSAGKK